MSFEVGNRVRSLRDFAGVPKGSEGFVIEHYNLSGVGGVTIGWDLPNHPFPKEKSMEEVAEMYAINPKCPIRDSFSPEELIFLELCQ